MGAPPASDPSTTTSADVATVGWWYGQLEPTNRGAPIWTKVVTAMGDAWAERCAKDPLVNTSGLFIDAPSAFANPSLGAQKGDNTRYPLLRHALEAFQGAFTVYNFSPQSGSSSSSGTRS